MEDWYELLPPSLLQRAYRAETELAWSREDALSVIADLKLAGYRVDKIEVWLPTKPGPEVLSFGWRLSKVRAGIAPSAEEYVKTFHWEPRGKTSQRLEPVFNMNAERLHS